MEQRQSPTPAAGWKRGFFTIAAGQAVSLIGSSAVQFALIWWLASESGSALVLSLAGLAAFLPQLFLGPFAGVWIDRMRRKTVIICADLFTAACAAAFALLFLAGDPPYWTAYLVLGLRALGGVFHQPALSAALPMLVPGEQLVRANSLNQFLSSGAFMLGPVLGAAMYAALPLPAIMLTDVLGAGVASATVALTRIPDPPRTGARAPQFLRELREGARAFLLDRRLCIVTLASTLCMVFFLPLSSLYPLMTTGMGGTAWHASAIELAYAGGMMLAAALMGLHGELRHKFRAVHLALAGLAATSLVCGLLPLELAYFWAFAALCFLMGGSGNIYSVPYVAYMQQTIPAEAQGRAFSLMSSLMSLAMPVGLLIAGPVAERRGVSFWFLLSGIAMLGITAASWLLVEREGKRGAA